MYTFTVTNQREAHQANYSQKKTVTVEGMSCQHCVNRGMEAVNSIDGASALVRLKKGIVIVSLEHPIRNEIIKNAIEKAGYTVTDIKE